MSGVSPLEWSSICWLLSLTIVAVRPKYNQSEIWNWIWQEGVELHTEWGGGKGGRGRWGGEGRVIAACVARSSKSLKRGFANTMEGGVTLSGCTNNVINYNVPPSIITTPCIQILLSMIIMKQSFCEMCVLWLGSMIILSAFYCYRALYVGRTILWNSCGKWLGRIDQSWMEFTYSRNIVPIVGVMAFMEYCVVKIAGRQRNIFQ